MKSLSKVVGGQQRRNRLCGILGAAVLAAAGNAMGANFTWLATPATNFWNTADSNWDAGAWVDVAATPNNAFFNTTTGSQSVTIANATTIHVNTLTFQAGGWNLLAGNATSLLTGGNTSGLLTISTTGSNTISAVIANNGTTPVTINGTGTLILGAVNTYTGLTTLGGTGLVQLGAAGNLGTGGLTFTAAETLDLNGRNQSVGALTSAAGGTITSNSGSGTSTLTLTSGATFNGTILDGSGKVGVTITGGTEVFSTGQAYTGNTFLNQGNLTLSTAAGQISASSAVSIFNATLAISSTASPATSFQRFGNASSDGGTITLTGNTANNTADTAGILNLNSSGSTVTVTSGAAHSSSLTFSQLTRNAGATAIFTGTTLGTGAATSSQLIFTAALTGNAAPVGNLTLGGMDAAILPYALAGTTVATATTFAVYGTNGVRAILAAETDTTNTLVAAHNMSLSASAATSGNLSINSMIFTGANAITVSGGVSDVLTVASGGIINNNTSAAGVTISEPTLDFGAKEGILYGTSSNLTISSAITGSGGLTHVANGTFVSASDRILVLSGNSTYTGVTTLLNTNQLLASTNSDAFVRGTIIRSNNALGVGDGTVGNGTMLGSSKQEGSLDFDGGVQYTTPELITIVASAGIGTNFNPGAIRSSNGDNLFAGNIILASAIGGGSAPVGFNTFVTDAGSSLTLTGVIQDGATGGLGLRKAGAGSLVIKNAMTYTGQTKVVLFTEVLTNQGNLMDVPGTLVLGTGGSIANSQLFASSNAIVNVDSSASGTAAFQRTNGLILAYGAKLNVQGNAANNTTDGFGTLTVNNGQTESYINITPGAGKTSTVQLAGIDRNGAANAQGNGGTLHFTGPNLGTPGLAVSGQSISLLTFTSFVNAGLTGSSGSVTGVMMYAVVSDTITGKTSFATGVANDANGIRGLSTNSGAFPNDYNTGTVAGVNLKSGNNLLTSGTTSISGATASVNTISMQGNGIVLNDAGGTSLTSTGILSTGTGNAISVTTLTNPAEQFVYVEGDLTINSTITDSSTAKRFTKYGSGELILTGNNTTWTANAATTAISVENGMLSFSSASNLGAAGNFIMIGGNATLRLKSGNTVDLTGYTVEESQAIVAGDPAEVFIQVDSGSTLKILTVASPSASPTGFTKTGTGDLRLTGTDTNHGMSYLMGGSITYQGSTSATFQNAGIFTTAPGTTINYDDAGSAITAGVTHQGDVRLNASNLRVIGSSTVATSDSNTSLTLLNGTSSVGATANGFLTKLTLPTFTRNAGTTVIFSGTSLGTATTGNLANILITTAPTLIGGAGNAGGILPYALADTTVGGTGTAFATYLASTGGVTANTSTTAGISAGNAVVTANDAGSGTINSLTINGSGISAGSGTLTVTSGGILNRGGSNTIGASTLAFGAAEGIVHALTDLGISSQITGTAGLTKAGAGVLTLTGSNTGLSGTVWVDGGTLAINSDAALGATSNGVVLNAGSSLRATASLTAASRSMTVNPGGTVGIIVDGGQNLTWNGSISNGTFTGLTTLASSRISVSGGGKLSLNGAVTTGVDVAAGTALGGTGTLTGGVTVAATGTIAPGNSIGTLTTSSLAMASGVNLNYEFGTAGSHAIPGSSDRLNVTGGAGSLGFTAGTDSVTLNLAGGTVTTGAYELFGYSNAAALANFVATTGVVGSTPGAGSIFLGSGWTAYNGATFTIANDTANSGIFLDLTIATGVVNATWTASTSTGNWSDGTNWNPSSPNSAGSTANFDGTGTLAAVNVDAPQTVGRILLSGSTNYTISGSVISMDNTGGVSAPNAVISSSAGTQTISAQIKTTAASDLGVTATGGTLTLSGGIDNTASKTVTLTATGGNLNVGAISNSGSLVVAGTGNTVTVTGAITGSGSVTVGSDTLILSSAGSNYGGGTTLNGGVLGGYGTITSTVTAGSGAHTIAPSATLSTGSIGTLTVGALTTNANTTLKFNIVTGASDRIAVTNNLNVSGGGSIQLVDASSAAEGYYKVLSYGSVTGNAVTSLSVLTPPPNSKEAYIIDTHHDAGFIDIHKALIGDVDGSGLVDGADFDIWFTHLQVSTYAYEQGDLNGDGLVDGADFDIWFTHLQNSFGGFTQTELNELSGFLSPSQLAGLGAAVPEPTSLALLGLGAMGLLGRRRRR